MATARGDQTLEKEKQNNLAHLRRMLELEHADPQHKRYLEVRHSLGLSTYAPINNILNRGNLDETAKKTLINSLFHEEQIMDLFAAGAEEKRTDDRINLPGQLLEKNGHACENVFMQAINGIHYFSSLIQVSSAMAKIQCAYAKFNNVPNASHCEFTLNNIKYMMANPNCMILGADLCEQNMSTFLYEEALGRLCPQKLAADDPRRSEVDGQISEMTHLVQASRLLYHITFYIECRQTMRRLNKDLRLGEGFNQIVGPFLLDSFTKIVAESQQSLPANVGAIGETLNSLDNLLCGATVGL